MFPKGLTYKAWAVIFTVFSFVVSNFGLSRIIDYSVPVLMFLYPPAIALILLALGGKLFNHERVVYVCVMAFTCFAALFDLVKTLPPAVRDRFHLEPMIDLAKEVLPLYSLNLGWVVPALLGLVMGLILRAFAKKK